MNFEPNNVYCGDCKQLIKQMPNKSIDVAFTSPPYNRIRNDTYELYDDTVQDYYGMLKEITSEMLRVAKRTVIVNVQMILFNKQDVCKYIGAFADKIKGIVVWTKTNPQPATNFKNNTYSVTNAYEFFFVLSADGDMEFRANNKVWNVISTSVNSEHFEGHGAVMKKEVCEFFIENFTRGGDLVLDPFFGMGTTGVVCSQHNRNFIGFELIQDYCDKAMKRIEDENAQIKMDFLN